MGLMAFLNGNQLDLNSHNVLEQSVTPSYKFDVDLTPSNYDRNKWYPIEARWQNTLLSKTIARSLILLDLEENMPYRVPWGSWHANAQGGARSTSYLFDYSLSCWGNRLQSFGYILDSQDLQGADDKKPIGIILPNQAFSVIYYLRGGGLYHLYLDYPAQIIVSDKDISTYGETFTVSDKPLLDNRLIDVPNLLSQVKSKLEG